MSIINPTWEEIFSSGTTNNKQLRLDFGDGLVLGNEHVVQESMSIKESLCSSSSLKLGTCESNYFKIRLFNNNEPDLTNRTLTVSMYLDDGEEPDYFEIGTYIVDSDTPTGDRLYHDIVCYDAISDILGKDYSEWWSAFLTDHTTGYTIKQVRDSFFEYIGIAQVSVTLVNDNVQLSRNSEITSLYGKDILNAIGELNGAFGHITRDNKFIWIVPNSSSASKRYEYYRQGSVDYNKYEFQQITRIVISGTDGIGEAGEETGNTYDISPNFLTNGLGDAALSNIAEEILTAVEHIVYRPFKAKTYGDLCVEVGDCIQIPTNLITIKSFVLERNITGIQALSDSLEAKGDRTLPATSLGARVSKIEEQVQNIDSVLNEVVNRIVVFENERDINIPADTWTALASKSFSANAQTNILVHAVAKITDLSGDGLVKFRYHLQGKGYEQFVHEVYLHEDIDTATLFTVVSPPVNMPTRLTIEVNIGNSTGTVLTSDFHCGFTGTHLVLSDWDGYIDADDVVSATFGGSFFVTDLTESATIEEREIEFINASDTVSATFGGSFRVMFAEDISVLMDNILFDIHSADYDDQIVSSDGLWFLRSSQ